MSEWWGCVALRFHRFSQQYCGTRDGQALLRLGLHEIDAMRVHHSFPRIQILLRSEGGPVSRKRVYRLHR